MQGRAKIGQTLKRLNSLETLPGRLGKRRKTAIFAAFFRRWVAENSRATTAQSHAVTAWSRAVGAWSHAVTAWSHAVSAWSHAVTAWSRAATAWHRAVSAWSRAATAWHRAMTAWSRAVTAWHRAVTAWPRTVTARRRFAHCDTSLLMAIELHVLADAQLLETFRLAQGMHLLGSSKDADLLLSTRDVSSDICRIELGAEGEVTIRSLDETAVRRSDGTSALQVALANGDFAESGRFRLLVLDRAFRGEVQFKAAPQIPATAPTKGIVPPSSEPLALRIRSDREIRVVPVDQPTMVFGRGPDNAISFGTPEVSRHHARLIHMPTGPWIEDLGSTHGTFLDGVAVTAAAWRLGAQVRLSSAPDAPTLELLSLPEALAEPDTDEAVTPLRGRSEAMQIIRRRVLRYGSTDQPILIIGETGTGKELVAAALARLRGAKRPFQALNCGAIPEPMIESILFGCRKGAFTGASQDRAGELEAAGDGTLFLDEIGDMPLAQQVKLLRVLETREVQRLGETHTRPFRARVVAATHRDLGAMVAAGQFREDLYHRIAVTALKLPPLRARLEDLPSLARLFLASRSGKSAGKTLSEAAMDKLRAHRWPGNVRELKHVVEHAAGETDVAEIGPDAIEFLETMATANATETPKPRTIENLPAHLDGIIRDWCRRALAETAGNIAEAARVLGLSRSGLRHQLERLDITFEEASEPPGTEPQ